MRAFILAVVAVALFAADTQAVASPQSIGQSVIHWLDRQELPWKIIDHETKSIELALIHTGKSLRVRQYFLVIGGEWFYETDFTAAEWKEIRSKAEKIFDSLKGDADAKRFTAAQKDLGAPAAALAALGVDKPPAESEPSQPPEPEPIGKKVLRWLDQDWWKLSDRGCIVALADTKSGWAKIAIEPYRVRVYAAEGDHVYSNDYFRVNGQADEWAAIQAKFKTRLAALLAAQPPQPPVVTPEPAPASPWWALVPLFGSLVCGLCLFGAYVISRAPDLCLADTDAIKGLLFGALIMGVLVAATHTFWLHGFLEFLNLALPGGLSMFASILDSLSDLPAIVSELYEFLRDNPGYLPYALMPVAALVWVCRRVRGSNLPVSDMVDDLLLKLEQAQLWIKSGVGLQMGSTPTAPLVSPNGTVRFNSADMSLNRHEQRLVKAAAWKLRCRMDAAERAKLAAKMIAFDPTCPTEAPPVKKSA